MNKVIEEKLEGNFETALFSAALEILRPLQSFCGSTT